MSNFTARCILCLCAFAFTVVLALLWLAWGDAQADEYDWRSTFQPAWPAEGFVPEQQTMSWYDPSYAEPYSATFRLYVYDVNRKRQILNALVRIACRHARGHKVQCTLPWYPSTPGDYSWQVCLDHRCSEETAFRVPGPHDVNGDGCVDGLDAQAVMDNFGDLSSRYDYNGDFVVDYHDVVVVQSRAGTC